MKKKILIIDDERDAVQYLSRRLENENFEPLIAYNGHQGLRILAHQKVDAVITDNAMAEMDGYTFCKRLKELRKYEEVPILVCTAHSGDERAFRTLGIDDYIVKPVKFDYLFKSLNRVLNRISHRIKFKKVLVQTDQTAGIRSAEQQIREYGFRIDVYVVPQDSNIIEEAIRHQSDIVVFNALLDKKSPEIVITSLKSYVEFKDLKIVLYGDCHDLDSQKKDYRLYVQNLKESCAEAGADGWIDSLSRENFLNLLFEHCKG